jgi:hypothetical protein
MGYQDFTALDVLTATQVDMIMRQTIMTFSSTTARDTALSGVLADGMFAYTTTTPSDTLWMYNGTSWEIESEPVQAWSVTAVTQSGSVAFTTTTGWYQRRRGTFTGHFRGTVTGAGSAANGVLIPYPVVAASVEAVGGTALISDSSASTNYFGYLFPNTVNNCYFVTSGATSFIGANPSFALANGDVIDVTVHGRY